MSNLHSSDCIIKYVMCNFDQENEIHLNKQQETLCVLTIAMICSTLTWVWKFQYFRRPLYNPVKHLRWRFYCENSKSLSIFTKSSIADARLGSKYTSAFWRLIKRLASLNYYLYTLNYLNRDWAKIELLILISNLKIKL